MSMARLLGVCGDRQALQLVAWPLHTGFYQAALQCVTSVLAPQRLRKEATSRAGCECVLSAGGIAPAVGAAATSFLDANIRSVGARTAASAEMVTAKKMVAPVPCLLLLCLQTCSLVAPG